MDALTGAKWLSTIDMAGRYLQVAWCGRMKTKQLSAAHSTGLNLTGGHSDAANLLG